MSRTLDLDTLTLQAGAHDTPDDGMCVMEAVSFIAGEPFSDRPACASPVIGAFLRSWNDALDDAERQQLKRHIPALVGTAGTAEQEERRSWMAVDWLVRVHAPAWLRLAGLTDEADMLEGWPEVTPGTCSGLLSSLEAVCSDAYAAKAAAWAAARAAARVAARAAAGAAARAAAWTAARAAAWDAARAAAWDAAGAAAGDAAGAAARAAARDAAGAAAWDAAGAVARDVLAPTRAELQSSAHRLVERMIEVTA